jgi:hypothetical protein
MIVLGVVRIALGDLLGGVWTIFIAWFLIQAAVATRQTGAVQEHLPVSSTRPSAA